MIYLHTYNICIWYIAKKKVPIILNMTNESETKVKNIEQYLFSKQKTKKK